MEAGDRCDWLKGGGEGGVLLGFKGVKVLQVCAKATKGITQEIKDLLYYL